MKTLIAVVAVALVAVLVVPRVYRSAARPSAAEMTTLGMAVARQIEKSEGDGVDVFFVSADVQETDSAEHPFVGVVVLSRQETRRGPGVFLSHSERAFTLRVVKERGKWRVKDGTERVVQDYSVSLDGDRVHHPFAERPVHSFAFSREFAAAQE